MASSTPVGWILEVLLVVALLDARHQGRYETLGDAVFIGAQRASMLVRSLRGPWSGLRNDRVGLDKTTDRLPQAKVNMTVTAVNIKYAR